LQILERWFRKKLQNARRAKTEEGSALHPGRCHDEVKAQRRRQIFYETINLEEMKKPCRN
jgi:hypothetical protein